MIEINVNGSVVSVQKSEALYSGAQNVHTCHFNFDKSWEKYSKSAVFRAGGKVITAVVNEENICVLPWELLVRDNIGLEIDVGVYGVCATGEILTSVWDSIGTVREGSEIGSDAREPSAGVYEQVMASVQKVDDKIISYSEEVQTLTQRAESAAAVAADSSASALESRQAALSAAAAAVSARTSVDTALNNLPAGSTLVINDLTTGGTSAALSAEMGKVLNCRPNPNLLHNWYFANPINQRGQTEYTDGLYTIDRWGHNGGTVQIGGGLSWSQAYVLFQPFEYSLNDGKRRIFSYLDSAGNLASGELTTEYSLIGEVMVCHANTNHLYLLSTRSDLKIVAVKLELGDTQTLAHWDGSKWVMNEIPDYNEELLKCCMSKADSGDGYSNKTILHTGNKLSGSYTGNGSTMEVSIGGIGNALLLTNSVNGRSMIVMYAGAIGISGGNVVGYNWSAAQYVNGTLKLNSAEVDLNASGVAYKYEVL